jgi:hypothetical protein
VLLRDDGEQRVIRCAHAGVFADGRAAARRRDRPRHHRERQVERLKADFIATVLARAAHAGHARSRATPTCCAGAATP